MDVQGLEIDIRAMAAAGAESVSNGGCSPDDTLYLIGDPEEDRPRVNKFINKLHETSKPVGAVVCCLPDARVQAKHHTAFPCTVTTSAQIITKFRQDRQALLAQQQRQTCHWYIVGTFCLCVAGQHPAAYYKACQACVNERKQ